MARFSMGVCQLMCATMGKRARVPSQKALMAHASTSQSQRGQRAQSATVGEQAICALIETKLNETVPAKAVVETIQKSQVQK